MLQRFATDAAVRGLNHLLAREAQARAALAPLAGRVARLQAGPFALQFSIVADGSVQASEAPPNVTIGIDPRVLAGAIRDVREPADLLRDAHVEGDAELAQALSRVAGQIRPDLEEDLARVVGDAAAVRIFAALRSASGQIGDSAQRLGRAVTGYLADSLAGDPSLLGSRAQFDRFTADLADLEQAVEHLAERVGRLR